MKKIQLIFLIAVLSVPLMGQKSSIKKDIPDDIKRSKVYQRYQWFHQQRAYPFDTIPQLQYQQAMRSEISRMKNDANRSASYAFWEPIGPAGITPLPLVNHWGEVSGRVRAIAIHPTDPLTVYIGAACGGIWKTTDGGISWQDIGAELESLSFGAIAIDPSNPDIVYAGSGEVSFLAGFIHFNGKGLFKSTDAGNSWSIITDGFGDMTHFSDIVVSNVNPNLVFASLGSGGQAGTTMPNEGVWKSTDAGQTWTRLLDVEDAFDLAFHPTDTNKIFAGVGGMNADAGFYISSDQGVTWTQINAGLQDPVTNARMQFDISLSNPDILYCVIYELGQATFWSGTTRAYKSVDGGNTWAQISEGIPLGGKYATWMDQGFYDLCIAVDPVDPDHVFIGNIELHETVDGSIFSPVRPFGGTAQFSLVHPDYHKLVFAPSNPDYLYIGCDGGIYLSTDVGQTAESRNNGLEATQFYRIGCNPLNHNSVIAGAQDNGTVLTQDGGVSWKLATSGDGMECFYDYEDTTIVFASVQNGRLTKSTDGGNTFNSFIFNGLGAWCAPFFMHASNHLTLYTANKSVIRSTTGGVGGPGVWEVIAENVAPTNISTMAQSPVNSDHMILGSGGGTSPSGDSIFVVMTSIDEGFTWVDVSANIPGEVRWISRVACDPVDENTMYVVRCGLSPGNKLYKSSDLGVTWTNISSNLPDIPCNDVFIDPEDADQIFLATDIGVYHTYNGGDNWEYAGEGMPFVPVFDFDYVKLPSGGRYLRAGTHGRSIYELNLLLVNLNEPLQSDIQAGKIDIDVRPNPFTNQTMIIYTAVEEGSSTIEFYDSRGKMVDQYSFGHQNKGPQQFIWNASALPAGVYFMRIQSGNRVGVSKVVRKM